MGLAFEEGDVALEGVAAGCMRFGLVLRQTGAHRRSQRADAEATGRRSYPRASTNFHGGPVLRRGSFSITRAELPIEVNNSHDPSIAVFQYASLIVIGPRFCTRSLQILAPIKTFWVLIRDLASCGPFCERTLPKSVFIPLLAGTGSLKASGADGAAAVDGFVSVRPTMNVATR